MENLLELDLFHRDFFEFDNPSVNFFKELQSIGEGKHEFGCSNSEFVIYTIVFLQRLFSDKFNTSFFIGLITVKMNKDSTVTSTGLTSSQIPWLLYRVVKYQRPGFVFLRMFDRRTGNGHAAAIVYFPMKDKIRRMLIDTSRSTVHDEHMEEMFQYVVDEELDKHEREAKVDIVEDNCIQALQSIGSCNFHTLFMFVILMFFQDRFRQGATLSQFCKRLEESPHNEMDSFQGLYGWLALLLAEVYKQQRHKLKLHLIQTLVKENIVISERSLRTFNRIVKTYEKYLVK